MSLLINEPPLMVLPSLAAELGTADEAIVLQQLHYWLQRSNNVRDGHKWVYNSMNDWLKQFPWIKSRKRLTRYFDDLESRGLVVTGNYNKAAFDKTKWYRIDYDALSVLEKRLGQNDPTSESNRPNGEGQNDPTNTNRLPETTSENKNKYSASHSNALSVSQLEKEFEEVWSKYPNKKGKKQAFNHYKAWRKSSTKHTNEYLIDRLDKYLAYCQQNSWYHPMNGSTWFNGRFDDELEVDNPKPANKYEQEGYYDDYKKLIHGNQSQEQKPIDIPDDELPF